MDKNDIKNIPQLNRLLQIHEQFRERSAFKSFYQTQEMQRTDQNSLYIANYYNERCFSTSQPTTSTASLSTVFANSNTKKSVIHINPHVQVKSSIYVNPKLIPNLSIAQYHDQTSTNLAPYNRSVTHSSVQNKNDVYFNPKLVNKLVTNVAEDIHLRQQAHINGVSNTENLPITIPAIQSVPNSTLFSNEKLKTSEFSKEEPILSSSVFRSKADYVFKSKMKIVKNTVQTKIPNIGFVSRTKLVRVKRSPKSSLSCSTPSKSISPTKINGVKKLKVSPKNIVSKNQLVKINNLNIVKSTDMHKINWYNKIDKSIDKNKISPIQTNLSNSKALVSIGGVMYKTTRNQLIRSIPGVIPIKRKRSSLSSGNSQYLTTQNEKNLSKLDTTESKTNSSSIKLNTSVTTAKSYKTNASNKVKQKSLQFLRNKMRKNNQPCLMFQRFGFCANQLKGTCLKVHDKKQVAVCKNFLQGKCFLNNCPLSHDIGPEKMPTCKYFLEGCCARDGCPYLHVKVSSKSPICVEFLRGYCPQGNECQKRHINACPEFDKNGKCIKGKSCPYPHKTHLTEIKRYKAGRRKRSTTNAKLCDKSPVESQVVTSRKRYYDETSEDLSQKREKLIKHMKFIKDVHIAQSSTSSNGENTNVKKCENLNVETLKNFEQKLETVCNKRRRPPIGPLPAYIPIK